MRLARMALVALSLGMAGEALANKSMGPPPTRPANPPAQQVPRKTSALLGFGAAGLLAAGGLWLARARKR